MLRPAITDASLERGAARQAVGDGASGATVAVGTVVAVIGRPPGGVLVVGRRRGRVPGEREEHVVERRSAQGDVDDLDAGVVESAHRLDEAARAAVDRAATRAACRGRRSAVRNRRPSSSATTRSSTSPSTVTSSTSPASRCLSSSGVPCAITAPWSMTTISDASWSASSRYCVVSRMVAPSFTRSRR